MITFQLAHYNTKLANLVIPKGSYTGNIGHFQQELRRMPDTSWRAHEYLWKRHGANSKWINYCKQRYYIKEEINRLSICDQRGMNVL